MQISKIITTTDQELFEWIKNIVAEKRKEDIFLDYKGLLNFNNEDKKELVKDISSFANTVGGTLLIGIPEQLDSQGKNTGLPSEEYGIEKIDDFNTKIYQILEDTIVPRLPNLTIRELCVSNEAHKYIYIIHCPKSWMKPHMARGYEMRRFYKRVDDRSIPMEEWEVADLYNEKFRSTKSIDNYIKNVDDGESLIKKEVETLTIKVLTAPVPINESFIDLFDECNKNLWAGRNFWQGSCAHSEWRPMKDAIELHGYNKKINESDYIIKLHPTGAISNVQQFNEEFFTSDFFAPMLIQFALSDKFAQFIDEHYRLLNFKGHIFINITVCNLNLNLTDGLQSNGIVQIQSHPEFLGGKDFKFGYLANTESFCDKLKDLRLNLIDELGKQMGIWNYSAKLTRDPNWYDLFFHS